MIAPFPSSPPIMQAIHLHEAAHSLLAVMLGGYCASVWADAQRNGGCAYAEAPAEWGQMVMLAGGEAGPIVVPGNFPAAPTALAPCPIPMPVNETPRSFAASMASSSLATMTENIRRGSIVTDRDAIDRILERLANAGKINRRNNWQSRWYWRARRKAERLLDSHRAALKALAGALAWHGALNGWEVKGILAGYLPAIGSRVSDNAGGVFGLSAPGPEGGRR